MYRFENKLRRLSGILMLPPNARATIRGGDDYPQLHGTAYFYQLRDGMLCVTEVFGLPRGETPCGGRVFAYHIHSGGSCEGTVDDPFSEAGSHFNPGNCPHPHHAGDMPPLFENNGYAFSAFVTNRFTVEEVIGRTVIVHDGTDDFRTQPSGDAGAKIACGIIEP